MKNIIPLILCGGSGSRLWPLSRENTPKQFLPLITKNTLLQETMTRAMDVSECPAERIISVTTQRHHKETEHQLSQITPNAITHLLCEPAAKNTAPAICYAALHAQKKFGDTATLWVMPSDHHIEDTQTLQDAITRAAALAVDGYIVTLGMHPTHPETGYGYIKLGTEIIGHEYCQAIDQFIEKPNIEKAQQLIHSGNIVWNSGMFIATAGTIIDNFKTHHPDMLSTILKIFETKDENGDRAALYDTLPALSFDVAIMEKTIKGAVIPCDIGWSDVGEWNSVHALKPKDANNNAMSGNVTAIDTKNCLIQSHSMMVATIGVRDLIIIEHQDSILIADRNSSVSLKHLIETLKISNKEKLINAPIENRPWGKFKILSEGKTYKIKELTVIPNGALSLQKHQHRSEFWTVISGEATVTLNDDITTLTSQQSIHIPQNAIHCLENKGAEPLIIIELQYGDYLGEDDIERFEK